VRSCLAIAVALVALAALAPPAHAQAEPPYLYWDNVSGHRLGRAMTDGTNVNQSIVGGIAQINAIGVAADAQYLYWGTGFALMRSDLDGNGAEELVKMANGIQWLAVDNRFIYMATVGRISRVNLDGSGYIENFIPNPGASRALAVDSKHIYWINSSAAGNGGIARANLDGTGVDPTFIQGASAGNGLAVDGQHIYWSNGVAGTIGRANLDGSGVDSSFISGLWTQGAQSITGVKGLAVDFEHLYWVNYYYCNYRVTPNVCGGGGIGRANLDGSGVDEEFAMSSGTVINNGCNTSPPVRCGPTNIAVSGATEPACLTTNSPPQPPPGGAVFWRPPGAAGTSNTVILSPGTTWTPGGPCIGTAAGSQQVMSSPTSIAVGPGAAVTLADGTHGLTSAWGGQTTPAGGPAPVLFPGRSDFQTSSASLVSPEQLLKTSGGCAGCVFPDDSTIQPTAGSAAVAYDQDLSGAVLNGATVAGDFSGWDFSGAQLPGATLSGTGVSGTDFSGADLRGAHMASLVTNSPPNLANVRIGPLNGTCTIFANSDLVGAGLTPVKADLLVSGCAATAMFPNTRLPIGAAALMTVTDGASVDYSDTVIVVTAGNADALKGAALQGIHLAGARFTGFPPDLAGTHFDNAALQATTFDLANLTGATFGGADATGASFVQAQLTNAQFPGSTTKLESADFIGADVSGASFQNANLTSASFVSALADNTNFNSVIAPGATFNDAHIYGESAAFEGARQLNHTSWTDAVIAGSSDGQTPFDFTGADLTAANFSDAQCIYCNFTNATLDQLIAIGAYMPGAQFDTVTLQGAQFSGAWLYCGNTSDTLCAAAGGSQHAWPLALGSAEDFGPVPFSPTTKTDGEWSAVANCPSSLPPNQPNHVGCDGEILPQNAALTLPLACSFVALDACPTTTSTLFNAGSASAAPLAVVPATPPTWATTLSKAGTYAAFADGTVRLIDLNSGPTPSMVAGTAGQQCPAPAQACGDGGPATAALLDTPSGLALGIDGSLYIADSGLLRVRRIAPDGTISTVAGSGQACAAPTGTCGDGAGAVDAQLADPQAVWVSPSGQIFIADGKRGIRRVGLDGTITTVPTGTPGTYDIVGVAGDAAGTIWAAANGPDYILKIDVAGGTVTQAVGTGTSGYNGNTDENGILLPGNQVQVNAPHSLSVALNGDVAFADTENHLIRAYNAAEDTVIDDIAGVIDEDTGNPTGGFNNDGQYADATELDAPLGVSVTRTALYVIADTGNTRVRQVGPTPSAPDLSEPEPEPGPPVVKPPVVKPPVGEPPAGPDNRFAISRVRVKRNGTVTMRVKVRATGTLRALVTTKRNGRQRAFAKGEKLIRSAPTVTLRAKPTARGKRIVRRDHGRLALRLAVTFRPSGGDPRTDRMRGLRLPASS
jgi:uncharacterized protein YjbI with pentapeptide repeats